MNCYWGLAAAILVAASQAHAAPDGSSDILDVVLEKYQSASGEVDWVRLRHDLAARKKTAKVKSVQVVALERGPVVVTVTPSVATTSPHRAAIV